MPLSRHAQEEVEAKIRELAKVYKAGYNDALSVPINAFGAPTWIEFLTFLTGYDSDLADYAHPHLFES